jgi:hypothetical protein
MSWRISIPSRSRSDSLSDVAEAARVLPADEARVTRQLVLGAIVDGTATSAGELIDLLEKASPETRRKMLDTAREKAGLPTASEIEFRHRHAAVQRNAQARALDSRPARFAYNESGLVVDLAEREVEAAKVRATEESFRRQREEREAQRAELAAEHAAHERARDLAEREASRDQFP